MISLTPDFRKTYIPPDLTKVGIVYGSKSGHVRRHIYPSQGDRGFTYHQLSLLDGEAMCFVSIESHCKGHDAFHAAIRKAVETDGNVKAVLFAGEPGTRIFARVDRTSMIVDNVTMADPDIQSDLLILKRDNWIEFPFSKGIGIGWMYSSRKGFWNPAPLYSKMMLLAA